MQTPKFDLNKEGKRFILEIEERNIEQVNLSKDSFQNVINDSTSIFNNISLSNENLDPKTEILFKGVNNNFRNPFRKQSKQNTESKGNTLEKNRCSPL